jgi:hypothetical protein
MTDIEELLRDELLAQAGQVHSGQLRELLIPRRRAALRRPRRMLPWLAPAAAALAVLSVIMGARVVLPGGALRPAAGALAGMPRFYVSVPYAGGSLRFRGVVVKSSATGTAIATVTVPGRSVVTVLAAADDRTFVLATWAPGPPSNRIAGSEVFYRMRLSASGQPGPLQRLPVNFPAPLLAGIALSPDGSTLAAVDDRSVALVSLRTGAVLRSFSVPQDGNCLLMSFVRGNQTLAFRCGLDLYNVQLRVLDTRAPGGTLLGDSRVVPLRLGGRPFYNGLITAGGSRLLVWSQLRAPAPGVPGDEVLWEFSMRTGRKLGTVLRLPTVDRFAPFADIFSADPTGRHLLIGGLVAVGTIELGTITPYPEPYIKPGTRPTPGVIPPLITPSPYIATKPKTEHFFGRIDNGQFTRLAVGGQGILQFSVW